MHVKGGHQKQSRPLAQHRVVVTSRRVCTVVMQQRAVRLLCVGIEDHWMDLLIWLGPPVSGGKHWTTTGTTWQAGANTGTSTLATNVASATREANREGNMATPWSWQTFIFVVDSVLSSKEQKRQRHDERFATTHAALCETGQNLHRHFILWNSAVLAKICTGIMIPRHLTALKQKGQHKELYADPKSGRISCGTLRSLRRVVEPRNVMLILSPQRT